MNAIVLIFFVASAVSSGAASVAVPFVTAISSQYHSQDGLGQYSYGYANEHSAKSEVRTADGTTRGGYSYIDAEGKLQSIEYIADPLNGFRATGSNILLPTLASSQNDNLQLPTQVTETPEVAEARAKHMAAVEEARNRALQQVFPGNYFPLTSTIAVQHFPAGVSFRSNVLHAEGSYIPGFSYNYGVRNGIFNQPFITTYAAAPFIIPGVNNIATSQGHAESPEMPKTKIQQPEESTEQEKSKQD